MSKILVVDDEEGIVDLLVDDLSDDGFDVISATNGAAALVKIYRERPDAVLLDLMLPLVNGYEVLREVRHNPSTKNIPIIMITAISTKEFQQTATQLGANYCLTKPWKPGSIQELIRIALGEECNSGKPEFPPPTSMSIN